MVNLKVNLNVQMFEMETTEFGNEYYLGIPWSNKINHIIFA